MLLNDDEVAERMESPLNLLNRLRTTLDRATSIIPSHSPSSNHAPVDIPSLPPSAADIIPNLDEKVEKSGTRSKAVKILNAAMDELSVRIPEIQKPEKLAQIASEMSKVISNHDSKGPSDNQMAKIVVYAPQINSISNYEIVEVRE